VIAAQSYNQMHWFAGEPKKAGYKKHGFIGMEDAVIRSSWSKRVHRNDGLTFPNVVGVMDVLGGDWQNAVYKVTAKEPEKEPVKPAKELPSSTEP